MAAEALALGGLVPFSSVDFPGRLAAVLFLQGCPLNCRYCHNPHLRRRGTPILTWDDTLSWLRRRQGLLDAVVFSGGEPTVQSALPGAIEQVRGLGFAIGLHSAGSLPERLERTLPRIDWIGLDVKAPFDRYAAVTGVAGSGARARRSLEAVLHSGVAYELRTTVHTDLLDADDLMAMAHDLAARGVRRWVLQGFRPQGCEDAALPGRHRGWELAALLPGLSAFVPDVVLR